MEGREEGIAIGRERGLREGRENGLREGRQEMLISLIRKKHGQGKTPEEIAEELEESPETMRVDQRERRLMGLTGQFTYLADKIGNLWQKLYFRLQVPLQYVRQLAGEADFNRLSDLYIILIAPLTCSGKDCAGIHSG